MRILFVTDALAIWGGIERILVEKSNYLADNCGFDVHFITVNQGLHPILFPLNKSVKYKDLNIRFHQQYDSYGIGRIIKKWSLRQLFVERLCEYVSEVNPDLIVTARTELLPGIVSVKGEIPLVYESHSSYIADNYLSDGWFSLLKSKYLIRNVQHAKMVVSLTDGDAAEWRKIMPNVCVIPNFVNLNKTGIYSNCENKTVIFVGRFSRQKDIYSLLTIWSIVSDKYPDWQLHIYGGYGEEQNHLVDIIREKYNNISVFPPTPDIFDKYLESSLLLLTSLFEPFGLVLPEAMSCGLPVVAFDCPYGPAEIITDGEDGFLIKDRDINHFAEKVCLLMDNPDLRKKMGQAGILSSQRYKADNIMPQWKELFEQLINKR